MYVISDLKLYLDSIELETGGSDTVEAFIIFGWRIGLDDISRPEKKLEWGGQTFVSAPDFTPTSQVGGGFY